jgi:phage virion morphogenesis protein
MITVQIESGEAQRKLNEITAKLDDPTPLMEIIAGILESETEEKFQQQGRRPHWLPLNSAYEAAKAKRKGTTVLKILQDIGILAGSLSTRYGSDYAEIGSNVPYAAIHQFGGQTRPHTIRPRDKKALAFTGKHGKQGVKSVHRPGSKIPARPCLPPCPPPLPPAPPFAPE